MMASAYPGLHIWLLQRSTAVIMVLYFLLLISLLLTRLPLEYEGWRNIFAPVWMKAATFLFFWSLFIHAWLGVKNVFTDYIKDKWLRRTLLAATLVSMLFYAAWALQILWGLGA